VKRKFIITAVLFTVLACGVMFAASKGYINDVSPYDPSETLGEIKGEISNGISPNDIAEDSTAETTAQTTEPETTAPVPETTAPAPETTEPETIPPETLPPETIPPETLPPVTAVEDLPNAPAQYFDSSLFIGDSRTVGLSCYADLGNATVFATKGMNVYRVFKEQIEVPGYGKSDLDNILSNKKYDKIYLMLGLNEIGYNSKSVMAKYSDLLSKLRAAQPDATIYLQANIHITSSRSAVDDVYNNARLDLLNDEMSALANGTDIFYLDANSVFDDEKGGLKADYAVDDFHLKSSCYELWLNWIAHNSI